MVRRQIGCYTRGMRAALITTVVLGATAAVLFRFQPVEHDEVHHHAAFSIYVDGAKVDFSDLKYTHVEPCTNEEEHEPLSAEEEQLERAHLHDLVGDVVHVHRPGVVWGDLFENLSYEFGAPPVGYVDGTQIDDILNRPIEPDQRVLFVIGALADPAAAQAALPTVDYIRQAEAAGESC